MRSLLVSAALVASIASGTAGCVLGCPTALATGVLVADGSNLVLEDAAGETHQVVWPSGYRVSTDGTGLVLTDFFGSVKAREGDRIEVGGGAGDDGEILACGDVTVPAQ